MNALRIAVLNIRVYWLRNVHGMDLSPQCRLSLKARLDKSNPRGMHIGPFSFVAFGATVLSHVFNRSLHRDTVIGSYCFIGLNAVIMPGVDIGNHVIVGAGAVVTERTSLAKKTGRGNMVGRTAWQR